MRGEGRGKRTKERNGMEEAEKGGFIRVRRKGKKDERKWGRGCWRRGMKEEGGRL